MVPCLKNSLYLTKGIDTAGALASGLKPPDMPAAPAPAAPVPPAGMAYGGYAQAAGEMPRIARFGGRQ